MTHSFKLIALAVVAGMAVTALSVHAQSATATISGAPVTGGFDYTVTLDNTGSLALNSFWYGWIQFENDLPNDPTSAGNSLGWNNDLDANSIQYVNSTGTALAPGHTATFTFFDTSTPAQITSGISGESVAYVGGIDFSQGEAGDSTGIITPTLVTVPEPSTLGLIVAGFATLFFRVIHILTPLAGIRKK